MTRLWYDATESRAGSLLPANVISFGVRLVGLEELTGADFVLSPLAEPTVEKLDAEGQASLVTHCRAGLLVQRKSGLDLVSSLGRLAEIQCRMQQWGAAWLLVTGDIRARAGIAVVNGRRSVASYKQVIGALDSWTLRGGGVTHLCDDREIGAWIELMLTKLGEMSPEKEVVVGLAKQKLVKAHLATREQATVVTLSVFPGISEVTARRIARACGGRLGRALEWISCDGHGVNGVGVKTVSAARAWLGLEEGEGVIVCQKEKADEQR